MQFFTYFDSYIGITNHFFLPEYNEGRTHDFTDFTVNFF